SAVHDAHDAHDAVIAPPEGTLWPTDESLRTAMSRIQAAAERAVAARPLTREAAHALAGTVEENVAYMVENCKLPPEPDAALHVLIHRMLSAANLMKQDASSNAAVEQLVGTLHDYYRTFDHSPASSDRH